MFAYFEDKGIVHAGRREHRSGQSKVTDSNEGASYLQIILLQRWKTQSIKITSADR